MLAALGLESGRKVCPKLPGMTAAAHPGVWSDELRTDLSDTHVELSTGRFGVNAFVD